MDRRNVEHDHDEDGLSNPRNWEDPDNIETEEFATISKRKFKVDGDICELSHNIPQNKKGKTEFRQIENVRICMSPPCYPS